MNLKKEKLTDNFWERRAELHVIRRITVKKKTVNLEACLFASRAKRKPKMSCNAKRAIHTKNEYYNNYNHKVLKITPAL